MIFKTKYEKLKQVEEDIEFKERFPVSRINSNGIEDINENSSHDDENLNTSANTLKTLKSFKYRKQKKS